jgi:obg-like ATPase 1
VKAWTIQRGYKAPQAAGRIHTDFEKGFIMAEVMNVTDLRELGTEAAVKVSVYARTKSNRRQWDGKPKRRADPGLLCWDFFARGGGAQAAGKYRQQGKTYEVQDGDIIFFKVRSAACAA